MAAGRYIGRIMLALAISNDSTISPDAQQAVIDAAISESHSCNGKLAKGKPKGWYSSDLDKMIKALILQGSTSGKKVWELLPKAKVVGLIDSIYYESEYNTISIDSILGKDCLPIHKSPPNIKFKTIQNRLAKIKESL